MEPVTNSGAIVTVSFYTVIVRRGGRTTWKYVPDIPDDEWDASLAFQGWITRDADAVTLWEYGRVVQPSGAYRSTRRIVRRWRKGA